MDPDDEDLRQLPPSRRIADVLRREITDGLLAPGAKIPSERALAAQYSTARNTAAAAIDLLTDEGLLIRSQGRATIVRPETALMRLTSDRYSHAHRESGLSPFLVECEKQGKTGRFEVLGIERVRPDFDLATRLEVDPKQKSVLRRENVFWADEDPVQRVTTYVPWSIADGTGLLEEEVPHPYGIHGVLEDEGHVMTRHQEEVTARMPNPDERGRLRIPQGVPVLDVRHTSINQFDRAYEVTRFVLRADLNGLFYDSPVE